MDRRAWILVVPMLGAVFGYGRALHGEFVFDDLDSVVRDPVARSLGLSTRTLVPSLLSAGRSLPSEEVAGAHLAKQESAALKGGRGFTAWTFALNHAWGGPNPFGYHVVNLCLHLAVTLLVFLFTGAVLRRAEVADPMVCAWVVAGVFALHPLHAQAVSYVTQRSEVIASSTYLGALLLVLRASQARWLPAVGWVVLALGIFVIGLGTKVIVVTMPVAYLLLAFVLPDSRPGVSRPGWPRHIALSAPFFFFAAWKSQALLQSVQGHRDAGFSMDTSGLNAWTYFMTEWKVLWVYLRLLFWPVGQCFDWRYPIVTALDARTVLAGAALAAIVVGVLVMLWRPRGRASEDKARSRIMTFGALWFLLLLAPTSSFVPIADVLAEHRVYLASWGVFVFVVVLVAPLLGRLGGKPKTVLVVAMVGALWGALALGLYHRNRVWENAPALWGDAVAKAPGNVRARVQLAGAHQIRGNLQQAVAAYGQSLSIIAPNDVHYQVQARLGLGSSLVDLGRVDDGIAVLEGALARDPTDPETLAILSEAWWHRGDPDRAESFAHRALMLKPDLGNALLVLGAARTARADLEGAAEVLARAVRANPDGARAHANLADIYARLGRNGEACVAWREVLHLPAALPEEKERAARASSQAGCAGL